MYENNKFRSCRKDQQGNEYWRCTINGCTARLKTPNGSEAVDLISNNHSLSGTVANETVQALRTTCKRKATETACERPSKVIRTVLGDQDNSDVTVCWCTEKYSANSVHTRKISGPAMPLWKCYQFRYLIEPAEATVKRQRQILNKRYIFFAEIVYFRLAPSLSCCFSRC